MLADDENLIGLMAVNRELVAQAEGGDESGRVVLDMDSTESPVHGQQEGSAYNGHFESVCYHPLLLFNQHGDCLAAKPRPGNISSAEDWDELLSPEIERQQAEGKRVTFRADAAFAKPEIYEALEERDAEYVIRIPANRNLELEIEDILFRPPGRPSRKPLRSSEIREDGVTCPSASVADYAFQWPRDGSTHWSCRELAQHLGISKHLVHCVWREAALKLHRLERYMASNDPDFETKAADVIGLYLDPPRHAAVFCAGAIFSPRYT